MSDHYLAILFLFSLQGNKSLQKTNDHPEMLIVPKLLVLYYNNTLILSIRKTHQCIVL